MLKVVRRCLHTTALRGVTSPIPMGSHSKIGGLCFSFSGTTADKYGQLTIDATQKTFSKFGVQVSTSEIRQAESQKVQTWRLSHNSTRIVHPRYPHSHGSSLEQHSLFDHPHSTCVLRNYATLLEPGGARRLGMLLDRPSVAIQWLAKWQRQPTPVDFRMVVEEYDRVQDELLDTVAPVPEFRNSLRPVIKQYNPRIAFITHFPHTKMTRIADMWKRHDFDCLKMHIISHTSTSKAFALSEASRRTNMPLSRWLVFDDTASGVQYIKSYDPTVISIGVTSNSSEINPELNIQHQLWDLRQRLQKAGAKHVISSFFELHTILLRESGTT